MSLIVVTGSTGQLGGRVARRLAAAGVAQRLLVRDPSRAPRLDGATVVQADYGDRGSLHEALDDAETVLMVSASESPDRVDVQCRLDRKSTRLNSSHANISYAVFCL